MAWIRGVATEGLDIWGFGKGSSTDPVFLLRTSKALKQQGFRGL